MVKDNENKREKRRLKKEKRRAVDKEEALKADIAVKEAIDQNRKLLEELELHKAQEAYLDQSMTPDKLHDDLKLAQEEYKFAQERLEYERHEEGKIDSGLTKWKAKREAEKKQLLCHSAICQDIC